MAVHFRFPPAPDIVLNDATYQNDNGTNRTVSVTNAISNLFAVGNDLYTLKWFRAASGSGTDKSYTALYRINKSTGVGNNTLTIQGAIPGFAHTAASIGNTVYFIADLFGQFTENSESLNRNLYSLNIQTLAAPTRIGRTVDSDDNFVGINHLIGIGGVLYGAGANGLVTVSQTTTIGSDDRLRSIITETQSENYGLSTETNSQGFSVNVEIGALFSIGSELYGISIIGPAASDILLFSINKTTGAATKITEDVPVSSGIAPLNTTLVSGTGTTTSDGESFFIRRQGSQYEMLKLVRAISAEWSGHAGEKTDDFSLRIDFAGTSAITQFAEGDILVQAISGLDTMQSGLDDYVVSAVPGDNNSFNVGFTPAENTEGVIEINAVGTVEVEGHAATIIDIPVQVSYDTNSVPILWAVPSTGTAAASPYKSKSLVYRVDFGRVVSGFSASDIIITKSSNALQIPTPTIETAGSSQIYDITFTLPTEQVGWIELEIPANSVTRTPQQTQTDSPRVYFDTRIVKWTVPATTTTISSDTAQIIIDFGSATTGFATTDITVGGTATGVTVSSVDIVQGSTQKYNIVLSIPENTMGTVVLTIPANSVVRTPVQDTILVSPSFNVSLPAGTYPIATRVGSATEFGVSEGSPQGLAAIGNTLYMLGQENRVLYILNTSTGVATRVGSAANFGTVNSETSFIESSPRGLAAIGNTLYMVGASNLALYTLNTSTGVATRVGSAAQFGVSEFNPTGLAAIGNTLYMVGTANDALYTLNTSTGVATRVGSATEFGVSAIGASDLAVIDDVLYMLSSHPDDALYILNTSTGVATRVGSAPAFGVGETAPTGLAAIGNTLYMVGLTKDVLYTLTYAPPAPMPPPLPDLGDLTEIGTLGVAGGPLGVLGSTLYMVSGGVLYSIDIATGSATRIGTTRSVSDLASIGNTMYAIGTDEKLYTINVATGAHSQVGSATNFGLGSSKTITAHMSAVGQELHLIVAERSGSVYNTSLHVLSTSDGTADAGRSLGRRRQRYDDITTIDNLLYVFGQDTDNTRSLSFVNPDHGGLNFVANIDSVLRGMEFFSSKLYAVDNTKLYTVDYGHIKAEFTGSEGTKGGDFSITVDFEGTDAVTDFAGGFGGDLRIQRISGDTLANAGLSDYTVEGPIQGTNNYRINFTPQKTPAVEGVFELSGFNPRVTVNGRAIPVDIAPVQIAYDTSQVPIEWTPESTGGAATNPKRETTYTFELDFNGQLSTPQLLVPGAFVVTRSSNNLAIIVSSVTAKDAANGVYNVTVSIPELSKGWFELNLPAGTVARQIGQPGQQSTDSQRVYFDTTLPLWTVPSGTSTTTTPTVQVDFRAGTSGFTAASLEVGGTADDGVRVFSVAPNGNSTQVYDITLLVPVDAMGNLNLTIQPASIMRTPAFTVADTSPNFNVDTTDISSWTVPTSEVTTASALARIDFGASVSGFAANEVLVHGSAAAGVSITSVQGVQGSDRLYEIVLAIAEETSGSITLYIPALAVTRTPPQSAVLVSPSFEINRGIADIEATITGFTGVKTSNFALRVDFNTVNAVTDFVAGDISLTRVGTTGADLMRSGLDDYTIAAVSGDNNSFLIQFTPASNISGTYMLDITGKVTENGKSRDVDVDAVTISVDTSFPAVGAIFQGAAGIKSKDFKIGVQFDDGTDAITGVTRSDFELTHISGSTLAESGVNQGIITPDPDNNRRYILTFPLNDNVLGTFQLSFASDAIVNVGTSSHNVASTPVTITFDSRLSDISATHQGPFEPNTTTPISTVTHEGFDIIVNFTTTGAITEFNTGNLSQRLNDPTMDPEYQTTIVPVDNDNNSFTIQFRLGPEVGIGGGISGSFVFDITGEVLDDGRRRNVTFTDATIRFNLPSYVRATITGSDNIAVAGAHSYMISFQSRFRITQFAQSDIEIQRISGSSLADAGLGNFSRNRESDTAYSVILTFRAHVNGRAELKLVGTVNIQGIGSNITILSDPIDIFYNTVPEVGTTPQLLQLPTITLQRGTLHSFSLDDHIFGDVNTVEISSSASWITLTGAAGDGVNRSLRYAPPSSLTVSGRFDEYSVLVTAVGDGGTRRMRAYVNIFAPDENPINLIYWDLPETDMGKITSSTIVVSAIFSRALIAGETLLVSDIEIQGVTGVSVTAVTVDPLNNHKYDISLAITQGAEGILEINIK